MSEQPPPDERLRVDFIYFDAGGGHRSAATALDKVIRAAGYPWDVRLVNLQEVLDSLDVIRKLSGIRLEDFYNKMLAKGWTIGGSYWVPLMHLIIRLNHRPSVALLTKFWGERQPDMVVSLVPNLNRAMFDGLRNACPDVPFVGILTDLADYPPHFWMEKQDQHIICGTDRAVEQAHQIGLAPEKIHRVSGMILRPDFYNKEPLDRDEEMIRLGLQPHLRTALVLFGGAGSNVMYGLCERLGNSELELQIIAICGHNQKLKSRLQKLETRNRIFVEGFTRQIPHYMALSDFFIGKPGPGSISEALHMGLPVIIEANSWTLPQERFNAKWVRENGYGIVLSNLRHVEDAVHDFVVNGGLQKFRERIAALNNRAVYEIPTILSGILQKYSGRRGAYSLSGSSH